MLARPAGFQNWPVRLADPAGRAATGEFNGDGWLDVLVAGGMETNNVGTLLINQLGATHSPPGRAHGSVRKPDERRGDAGLVGGDARVSYNLRITG